MDPKCHVELYFSYALMFFASPSLSSQSVTNLGSIFFSRKTCIKWNIYITRVNSLQKSMQPWHNFSYYLIKGILFFLLQIKYFLLFCMCIQDRKWSIELPVSVSPAFPDHNIFQKLRHFSRYWHFNQYYIGRTTGGTGQQRMLIPPRNLILTLSFWRSV